MDSRLTAPTLEDAQHVVYEVKWFRLGMVAINVDEDPQRLNLMSEAVLLHLRNLLEFFYPPSKHHPKNLYATDFLEWRPILNPDVDEFAGGRTVRQYHARLHRRLAHISRLRKDEIAAPRTWSLPEAEAKIEAELASFLQALPPTSAKWFSALSQSATGRDSEPR